jgi:hypothetical protein
LELKESLNDVKEAVRLSMEQIELDLRHLKRDVDDVAVQLQNNKKEAQDSEKPEDKFVEVISPFAEEADRVFLDSIAYPI